MYSGRSLMDLAKELDRQAQVKEDLIANTAALTLTPEFELDTGDDQYGMLPLAHRQVGDRVGIPAKYYNRMQELAPELLAHNVNHWFQEQPENRMIRLLDGEVRAFLSDRYQRRDNHELMQFLFPTFKDIGGLQMTSCEITEHKLYLKLTTPRVQTEIRKGDIVQAGLVISNSEVGLGAFKVQPLILRLVCDNGMISNVYGMSKYHVGRRIEIESDIQMLFSDETLKADDETFFLKCRDIVKGALSEDTFQMIANQLMAATENKIHVKPTATVERLTKKYSLTQDESENVLTSLLQESDLTQYGLVNAITHASHEAANYDRATEMEELGGTVLTLTNGEWKELAA
jgi:hypothetical protein